MIGRFERWFKQCDESILNETVAQIFRQHFVSQDAGVKRVITTPRTEQGDGTMQSWWRRLSFGLGEHCRSEAVMIIQRKATRILSAAAFVAAVSLAASAIAADAVGTWYTADKESQVKIVNCGGALCGTLVWLRQPNDPATGRPKTDKNNADASKQGRPLLGVPIVLGMKPSGVPNQWSGEVYNASDGKTYSGSFTLTGPNTADLKGCVLSVICKSQTWTRAN
jgi:uncharacterized protein (DUF2147 family)